MAVPFLRNSVSSAMRSLNVHVRATIEQAIVLTDEGGLALGKEQLGRVWCAAAKAYSAPAWKRFSTFMQQVCSQFTIGNAGTACVSLYKAHIIMVLLFEFGLKVDAGEFNGILEEIRQRLVVAQPDVRPRLDSNPSSDSLSVHSRGSLFDSQAQSSTGPLDLPDLSASSATRVALFTDAGRRAVTRVKAAIEKETFSDDSQHSDADVAALLTLIKQQTKTIDTLRRQKASLQQSQRRLEVKLRCREEAHEKELQSVREKRDFEVHHDNESGMRNGKKLKWSWMTPVGALNVAAPWLQTLVRVEFLT